MKVFFLALFCISNTLVAQNATKILKESIKIYENLNEYEVSMKYMLFKGPTSSKIEESYQGLYSKNGNNLYQKINQTEFISASDFSLKISHEERIVDFYLPEKDQFSQVNFDQILNECHSIDMEENDLNYIIKMRLKQNADSPFHLVIVKVYKKNKHISQVDIFYSDFSDFSDDENEKDLNTPHLRILYSDFKNHSSIKKTVFKFNSYFNENKNIITLNNRYLGYILNDNRFE